MMSTATAPPNGTKTQPATRPPETAITYTPLGETEPITLTLSRVKQFLCVPTKSGKLPSDEQVMKYMMLCKAGGLNPWVNDCYLTGYDSKDGPTFTLITAVQAFLKRAEASPEFDGIEQGVIVLRGDLLTERPGDLVLPGETLIGGWARVHRRDRTYPSYDALNLQTFDEGRSRWNKDKAGMIVKCAQASALRTAFPSTLAAIFCREEMERSHAEYEIVPETRTKAERLTERLVPAAITHETSSPAFVPQAEETRQLEPVGEAAGGREFEQQQEQPEAGQSFEDQIADAMTPKGLSLVNQEFTAAYQRGELSPPTLDTLLVLYTERMKVVKG